MDELCYLLDQYKKYHQIIKDKSLAQHLGLSNAYLCDIRKGRRRLSDKLIIKMTGDLSIDSGRYLIAARVAYSYEAEERLAWKRVLKKHTEVVKTESDLLDKVAPELNMDPELDLIS